MRISSSAGGLDWCRVYLHTRPHLPLNTHDAKKTKYIGASAAESSLLGGLSMSEAVSRAGGASSVASSTLSAFSTQAGEDQKKKMRSRRCMAAELTYADVCWRMLTGVC